MNKNTTMTKTIKLMATVLLCATLCGTATAAPRGNGGHNNDRGRNNAPQHQKAEAPRQNNRDCGHASPQKVRHDAHHSAPAPRHAQSVAYHKPAQTPAPAPRDPAPHHDNGGLVALGAAVVGGIVGGIIGACN